MAITPPVAVVVLVALGPQAWGIPAVLEAWVVHPQLLARRLQKPVAVGAMGLPLGALAMTAVALAAAVAVAVLLAPRIPVVVAVARIVQAAVLAVPGL